MQVLPEAELETGGTRCLPKAALQGQHRRVLTTLALASPKGNLGGDCHFRNLLRRGSSILTALLFPKLAQRFGNTDPA
jgi:hypothetical protein